MQKDKQIPKPKRSVLARIGRVFAIFILSLITLVILVLILIQTAPVQNFARKKIVTFLQKKLDTRVEIARLDIDFPKMLVLEGVYIEDKTKDTLIAGGQLKVDIDMFKLLKSEVQINEINLNQITAKIKRQLPDTTFNFQFIVDAFVTAPKQPTTDTSTLKMAIEKIIVDKSRFVYKDVVTGNDVDIYLNHFDTRISKFDLNNIAFDVPKITLQGLRGRIKQSKPIEITAVVTNPDSTVKGEAPAVLKFSNKEIALSDIDVDYTNDVSNLSTQMLVGSLNIYPEKIDLETSEVVIREIALNKLNGTVRMGAGPANVDNIKLTNDKGEEVATVLPWKVRINSIKLDDNNFKFDDNTKPRLAKGMDFAHMDLQNLTFHLDNFIFNSDSISGQVTKGAMTEKSGFNLKTFETSFAYNNSGVSLQDILIQTPGTEIKRSAVIKYPSLTAIQKNVGLLEMDINLENSKIQVKDILTFMPALAAQPAFRNPNSVIYVNSRVRGSVARLVIDKFQFRGLQQTNIDVAGTVYGLPDPNKVSADLSIRTFKTSRGDIMSLVPPNTIPPNITIPEAMSLSGVIKGNASQTYADLNLNTTLGSAKVKGTISNPTNAVSARYNATISANRLNVGAITKNPQMVGLVTATMAVNGQGFDPEKARATLKGNIVSADIKQYVYRNLRFDAAIANQHIKANANMADPNIHFALQAEGYMGGDLPGFNLIADIDSIKTQPLHLTPDAIVYRGKIEANFPQLNLDALEGQAYITNSLLVMNGQRVAMDSLSLVASYENNQQIIGLRTDFVNADIRGQYKLQQLGDIMMETVQPYFAINTSTKPVYVDPYNFTINASIVDHPTLRAFVPTITRLDPITLTANLSNGDGLKADVRVPYVAMGTNKIENLTINANTDGNALNFVTNVQQVNSGSSIALYQTTLQASLANNQINFGLSIRDKNAKDKYRLNGLLAQTTDKNYSLQLRPDSLLLNYDPWTIASNNMIRFGTDIVNATNFALSKNNQQLIINSTNSTANSPLEVRFADFKIATLTGFVQSDSLFADGTINGNVTLNNLLVQPNFTTDLTINDLSINKDTLGNLNAKVNNNTQDVFATNITLIGRGNDLSLTGEYYLKPANNSNLDFVLDIKRIGLETLEGASMGMIKNANGYLSGNVKVNGAITSPKVLGGISFNQADFTVSMLNSQFKIDNETIKVDNEGIKFDTFTIRDSANNTLVIDGAARTTNFVNYAFGITVKADNFRAVNSSKRDNPPYYGQLYFNTALNIKGTEVAPVVDGSLRINENTNFTVVIPQPEPGVVDRKGVIEFVDMDAPENDSLFKATMAMYDSSFNRSQLTGFDISANIEVVKEATFNVIVDEGNGDFLRLKGEAVLNGGVDPSGKITLTGSYVIDEGGYELSFNFLRRRFDMKKGGKITWTGEPMTADVDITAVYVANTSPLDLVGDQVEQTARNIYMQKLPFEVHLNVTGQLMQPILSFDIVLPTDKNLRVSNDIISTVTTRLDQLKTEPSELNKQVFALLLLNRFVSENPFESSGGGGGFNAGVYARQSVSRILTEQLNKLATDLVAGVEINFDLNSTEDYTTGEMRNRTDFNVNLSKRLLNDRLKVTVGSNFEVEGPQQPQQSTNNVLGNIAVDYNLTKDGRYLLRAYRKNDYDAVIEGMVIETGLRFVMTVDYNRFAQIFQYRKQRRQQKKAEKQLADTTNKTSTTFNIDTPEGDKSLTIEYAEKTAADDRKNLPVSDKVLTNEEN
jgi:translocation and assembly module TamB